MLIPQNGDRAGLYFRLSRDEDSAKESNSITNQRKILTAYAEEHHFKVIDEYIDDGVSGTTFDRPGFNRMIEDAQAGKINVIIVKDLSRLGRNYIGSGEHIENIFPKLGVRFISIGDSYDSLFDDEPSADMVPIINFFNEFHAKQTSKKTRASKKVMAQSGKFIGTKAPFGYVIDPDDKHHLLPDEEAAETVRLIFQYACDGLGYKAIAKRLRDAGVLNPAAYNNIKFPTLHKSEYWRKPHDWHPSSIKTILTNPTYLGKTLLGNYEAEQKELQNKRDSLQKELSEQKTKADETERFLQLIAGYKDIQELTAPMLNELIDRIEVGKKETVDGVKRQDIRIVYKQFCYVEFEQLWDLPVTGKERTTLVQAAV